MSKRIVDAVARGLPRRTAAKIAGVHVTTLFGWLRRGRRGDPLYVDFFNRVSAAEAKGEDQIVEYLRVHAKTSVPACIYLLERRNRLDWGKGEATAAQAKATALASSPEEQLALAESVVAALKSAS